MKTARIAVMALALGLLALFATPAHAQDGPSISVEPATAAPAEGVVLVVTGAGWTVAGPIFIVPCPAPESGDPADLDAAGCDTTALVPATPDENGGFEVTVTFDIPAGGLGIVASDAGSVESAVFIVGAEGGEAAPVEDPEATEEAEPTEGEGELANTGVETGIIAVVGIAVLAAGAMAVGASRRD